MSMLTWVCPVARCGQHATSDRPEDYGDYFAWGETAPKSNYNLATYKWYNSVSDKLTKYCTDDHKTELEPADDAATVNWGAGARMPSLEQIQELLDNCSWQWTLKNGVYGQLGTGPNGITIFCQLLAAGCARCSMKWALGATIYREHSTHATPAAPTTWNSILNI